MPWTDCTRTSVSKSVFTTLMALMGVSVPPICLASILLDKGVDVIAVSVMAILLILVMLIVFRFIQDRYGERMYCCNNNWFKKKLAKKVISRQKRYNL